MKQKEKIDHDQYFLNVRFIDKEGLEEFCALINKPKFSVKTKKKKIIKYSDLKKTESPLDHFFLNDDDDEE